MTSNVGGQLRGEGLGFCAGGKQNELNQAVQQAFTPEFLGRLDNIICFDMLTGAAMETIAWKYLRLLQERMETTGTQLQIPQEFAAILGQRCRGRDGARQLRRLVQTDVEGPLAAFLLRSSRRPTRLKLCWDGKEVTFCP